MAIPEDGSWRPRYPDALPQWSSRHAADRRARRPWLLPGGVMPPPPLPYTTAEVRVSQIPIEVLRQHFPYATTGLLRVSQIAVEILRNYAANRVTGLLRVSQIAVEVVRTYDATCPVPGPTALPPGGGIPPGGPGGGSPSPGTPPPGGGTACVEDLPDDDV